MAYSQNGRIVIEDYGSPLVSTFIPGTQVKYLGGLLPEANTIAMYWGHRWNTEIEPLAQGLGCWGYNYRAIRGQLTGFSNHASGTAWDTMAVNHPLSTQTLSDGQLATLRRMVTALRGAVRSGAFYTGRKDEMHCELDGDDRLVSAVAAAIRAGALPNTHPDLISGDYKPPIDPPLDPPVVIPDVPIRSFLEELMDSYLFSFRKLAGTDEIYEVANLSGTYHLVPSTDALKARVAWIAGHGFRSDGLIAHDDGNFDAQIVTSLDELGVAA